MFRNGTPGGGQPVCRDERGDSDCARYGDRNGHNIVDEYGHSALLRGVFMVRPMAVLTISSRRQQAQWILWNPTVIRGPQESLFAYNVRIRQLRHSSEAKMSKSKSFGLAELDTEERKDVVATLFVLILQIFGRLARVTDDKAGTACLFIDGVFRGRGEENRVTLTVSPSWAGT